MRLPQKMSDEEFDVWCEANKTLDAATIEDIRNTLADWSAERRWLFLMMLADTRSVVTAMTAGGLAARAAYLGARETARAAWRVLSILNPTAAVELFGAASRSATETPPGAITDATPEMQQVADTWLAEIGLAAQIASRQHFKRFRTF
jgi:hypothetical protein